MFGHMETVIYPTYNAASGTPPPPMQPRQATAA
ncbi:hypothetical protein D2E25_1580 [Bifidobacterium goeldii]|uniref:Uncharacterized protein n=1 Tax=Bifidobacterium goeldii TaxID=2306975 RepID=A0A430FH46_9BIFI|nr:hypothetical protein D2E25_1580 [Bifidobacterium goeldii]